MNRRITFISLLFACLIFSWVGCQVNGQIANKEGTAVSLQTINEEFERGAYCKVATKIEQFLLAQETTSTNWKLGKLLQAKTFLELEQWDKATEILAVLNTESNKSLAQSNYNYEIDLLNARLLEKREKLVAAELVYRSIMEATKAPTNSTKLFQETAAHYGVLQYNLGNYKAAEAAILPLSEQEIKAKPEVAKAFITLGHLYKQQSKSILAQSYFLKAKVILAAPQFVKHPIYALFLNDYALSYFYNGQMEVADSLLTLSEKINQNGCPIPSITGYNSSTRGNIQYELGEDELAKQHFQKANLSFQSIQQNFESSVSNAKLGEVYFAIDSLALADTQFKLALKDLEQFLGNKTHPYKAYILQGMAALEEYNWNSEKADSLYQKSIEIIAQTLGEKSITYGTALTALAASKEGQEEYETALALYQKAAELDTLLQGKYHLNYKTTLFNLARCYSKMDSTEQTLNYYQKAIALQLRLLNDYFGNFSEATRLEFRREAMGSFDVFNTYACFSEQQALVTEIQHINLATKNRALDFSVNTRSVILKTSDEAVQKDYQLWIKQKELLTKLYLQSEADRQTLGISIDSLQQATNDIEKQLTRSVYSKNINPPTVSFETLRQQLKPNEAAIDYFNVHITDEYGQFPDSIFYFALITRAEWTHPKLIQLLEAKALKEILELSSHYTLNAEVNHLLYQKIWQPLEPHLEGIETIHLSPDGLLHQISFSGLFPEAETDKTLIETYQFKYYSNLGDLIQASTKIEPEPAILLMANIDYDSDLTDVDYTSTKYFSPLAGTSKELEYLKRNTALKSYKIHSFEEELATEIKLKTHLKTQQPNIVHLATHGYFLEKKEAAATAKSLGERLENAENSFLRSGLVFSGVNKHWQDTTSIAPEKDGVLTALEVANLDLSETELVVLSACNTGRGALTDGEGIFGLQRAFKMAGAKYILVSLWKIPDTQTAELMNHFYTYLAQTQSPAQSLYLAQKEMQKVYANPFDWASFILFE